MVWSACTSLPFTKHFKVSAIAHETCCGSEFNVISWGSYMFYLGQYACHIFGCDFWVQITYWTFKCFLLINSLTSLFCWEWDVYGGTFPWKSHSCPSWGLRAWHTRWRWSEREMTTLVSDKHREASVSLWKVTDLHRQFWVPLSHSKGG